MNGHPQQEELLKSLVVATMPFGKFKGKILAELPVAYLEWFARKGFPAGKLGQQLSLVHTIKTNGLEHLLSGLRRLNQP